MASVAQFVRRASMKLTQGTRLVDTTTVSVIKHSEELLGRFFTSHACLLLLLLPPLLLVFSVPHEHLATGNLPPDY